MERSPAQPASQRGTTHVGIIGGGIVGLAHAWSAAKRGHRVTVFERGEKASGASVRNFGMIWPIGQPAGELRTIALRSRDEWLEVARQAGLWLNPCGSIHLAHRDDEWNVLREFAERAPALGYDCELIAREEVLRRSPAAKPNGLLGGLFSPTELCVNPRTAIPAISQWLVSQHGVQIEFSTTITHVEAGHCQSADGRTWELDRVVICGGDDLATLFPGVLQSYGLRRCKLQMLKSTPQPAGWKLGPHLASGLTLRHYANFAVCESLPALRQRITAETPELDRYGIHVMASQNDVGEVILGDSHEFDLDIEPFDTTRIDDLIVRELHTVMTLPDWAVTQRWHGTYVKHPTQAYFTAEPLSGVRICTGLGGAGMTLSFGLAEELWERWT